MTQRFTFAAGLAFATIAFWVRAAGAESVPDWIANRTAVVRFVEHQARPGHAVRQSNRIGIIVRGTGFVDLERDRNEGSISNNHVNSLISGPLETWIAKSRDFAARIDIREGAVLVDYRNKSHDQLMRLESDGAGGCRAVLSYVLRPGFQTFHMRSIKTKAPIENTSLSASAVTCRLENGAIS